MHADLVAISNLWQLDHRNDELRAEHEGLSTAARAAVAALAAAEALVASTTTEREELLGRARRNDRELADYAEKRDRTRRMIDEGTAPDYAAAERQLKQVLEIVDRLETASLEFMEQIEAADKALATCRAAVEACKATSAAARLALQGRDAPIRAELTEVMKQREPVAAVLPAEYRGAYAQLRQKKRAALVNTKENMCQSCQTRIPAQRVVETAMGTAVHTCPGCGGWLLP